MICIRSCPGIGCSDSRTVTSWCGCDASRCSQEGALVQASTLQATSTAMMRHGIRTCRTPARSCAAIFAAASLAFCFKASSDWPCGLAPSPTAHDHRFMMPRKRQTPTHQPLRYSACIGRACLSRKLHRRRKHFEMHTANVPLSPARLTHHAEVMTVSNAMWPVKA